MRNIDLCLSNVESFGFLGLKAVTLFPVNIAPLDPEVAPQWCCGSSSAADPEIGVSAAAGGGGGTPAAPQGPKSGRVKRMVRLAAELLLLLGLLLLTLHITVLRSSPLQQGNDTVSAEQDSQVQASLFLL